MITQLKREKKISFALWYDFLSLLGKIHLKLL